jgi:hypothetical protein
LEVGAEETLILSGDEQAHMRGRKHKRRVEVSGSRVQRPSSHYCKICDITTTSAQHMAMHVAGKVGQILNSISLSIALLLSHCSEFCKLRMLHATRIEIGRRTNVV